METKIFQIALVLVLVLTGFTGCYAKNQEGTSSLPSTTTTFLPPQFFLDSDGDGFNDWFEVNVTHYDPSVPNDRYIVLYFRALDLPGLVPYVIYEPNRFYREEDIPSENIIKLSQEDANYASLENAIYQIANKSDKNDIVFLSLNGHGNYGSIAGAVEYAQLDKWLDQIEAKVVIVTIAACESENAFSALKEGPCPRIVFVQTGVEFTGTLGLDNELFVDADTYGDANGYISVEEIANWQDHRPLPGFEDRSWIEVYGFSRISDVSNIASEIYITDYTSN